MLQWSDKHDNIVDVVNNNDNIAGEGKPASSSPWWQCAKCSWKHSRSNRCCGKCGVVKTKRSIDLSPRNTGGSGGGGKSGGSKGKSKGKGRDHCQTPCPTHCDAGAEKHQAFTDG